MLTALLPGNMDRGAHFVKQQCIEVANEQLQLIEREDAIVDKLMK